MVRMVVIGRCSICDLVVALGVPWGLFDICSDGGECMDYWSLGFPCKGIASGEIGKCMHPSKSCFRCFEHRWGTIAGDVGISGCLFAMLSFGQVVGVSKKGLCVSTLCVSLLFGLLAWI